MVSDGLRLNFLLLFTLIGLQFANIGTQGSGPAKPNGLLLNFV